MTRYKLTRSHAAAAKLASKPGDSARYATDCVLLDPGGLVQVTNGRALVSLPCEVESDEPERKCVRALAGDLLKASRELASPKGKAGRSRDAELVVERGGDGEVVAKGAGRTLPLAVETQRVFPGFDDIRPVEPHVAILLDADVLAGVLSVAPECADGKRWVVLAIDVENTDRIGICGRALGGKGAFAAVVATARAKRGDAAAENEWKDASRRLLRQSPTHDPDEHSVALVRNRPPIVEIGK